MRTCGRVNARRGNPAVLEGRTQVQELMKAGEFARFCRTTKETLRHYDRIGLLRPAVRAENGYRLYSYFQFLDYMLVSALQSSGASLGEVREYLAQPDDPRLHGMLEERVGLMDQQIRELQVRREVLRRTLDRSATLREWLDDAGAGGSDAPDGRVALGEDSAPGERGDAHVAGGDAYDEAAVSSERSAFDMRGGTAVGRTAVPDGADSPEIASFGPDAGRVHRTPEGHRWRVSACVEEYFLETPSPYSEDAEDAFLSAVNEHMDYCQAFGAGVEFLGSYRVEASCVATGDYAKGLHLDMRLVRRVESDRLHVKPAGIYLRWLNRIDLADARRNPDAPNPLFAAYDALRAFAREQGWRLSGDLYDAELSLYSGNPDAPVYTEASMRVSPA